MTRQLALCTCTCAAGMAERVFSWSGPKISMCKFVESFEQNNYNIIITFPYFRLIVPYLTYSFGRPVAD